MTGSEARGGSFGVLLNPGAICAVEEGIEAMIIRESSSIGSEFLPLAPTLVCAGGGLARARARGARRARAAGPRTDGRSAAVLRRSTLLSAADYESRAEALDLSPPLLPLDLLKFAES